MLYSMIESFLSIKLDRKAVDNIMIFLTFAVYWFMFYVTLVWITEHWKKQQEVPIYESKTGMATGHSDDVGDHSVIPDPSL
jgi:hypothetical protein